MLEASRVKRWRDTKRERGLKAVTIWLTTEEEQRLKDLALTYHCAPSELVQQALAQFRPVMPQHISNVTDRELIRELIRDELAALGMSLASVAAGMTVGPTETSPHETPTTRVAGPSTGTSAQDQADNDQLDGTETETGIDAWADESTHVPGIAAVDAVTETRSSNVTETSIPEQRQARPDPLDEKICALLRAHPEGESAKGFIAALGVPDSKVRLRLNALIKNRRIEMQGRGASLRYVLVPTREAAGF